MQRPRPWPGRTRPARPPVAGSAFARRDRLVTVPLRFRQVNDYAWAHRFLSGFPNFHEANYGQGVVRGTFLLGGDVAEWRDIRAADLGNPPPDDVGARFRATNDWAARNGY